MDVTKFVHYLEGLGVDFYSGVPDSLLQPFCNNLIKTYGIGEKHIIAANEGNAVALAAGYHLSTGKIPCVYLQNSGLGNTVNPITSLLNEKVYGIPCVFVIGWRAEPGVKDEPQHIFQGEITLDMLKVLDIDYLIIERDTTDETVEEKICDFSEQLKSGKSVAFVVRKNAIVNDDKFPYRNDHESYREEIIEEILKYAGKDVVISTTGKTSREVFEIRERNGQPHCYDFLTVGSMGHSSSIALAIALNKPDRRVWCIDGDGALLMHMGAMAVIGSSSPKNVVHIVINNEAHESVGGQPTAAKSVDLVQIAKGCSYPFAAQATNLKELRTLLTKIDTLEGPLFIEVKSAIGSRKDLGRPTTTPKENKTAFMNYLLFGEEK